MAWNRVFLGLLVILNLFLVYSLLWSDRGLFAYLDLKARYGKLIQQVEGMHCKSLELSHEIRLLKSDRQYIEKIIREQMKFVKPDEILYIFSKSLRKSTDIPPDALVPLVDP